MGRPTIDVLFKQLATSAVNRSARGIVALIIKDDTNETFQTKVYKNATEIETALFTATNAQLINDCFFGIPSKVIVIRIGTEAAIATALIIAAGLKFDYIGGALPQADQTAIGTWIKAQAALKKTFKAVTWGSMVADHESVINIQNPNVVFADARGTETGEQYVPTFLGILAGLPLNRSVTNFKCTNLLSVEEPAEIDATIDLGNLVLINEDDFVKVAAGVNTLITLTSTKTEDMKQIGFVEAMHLIINDITATFKEWTGNYKNKYDYQVLLISAIRTYFKGLENGEVLDNAWNNTVDVDVEAQKLAWEATGKDTSTWDDQTTKNNTFRRSVFLLSDLKILGAMENFSLKNYLQ